jgi:hypothetical protein
MKKVIRDPGYRVAQFIELLRSHGMRSFHESRVFPPRPSVLLSAPRSRCSGRGPASNENAETTTAVARPVDPPVRPLVPKRGTA